MDRQALQAAEAAFDVPGISVVDAALLAVRLGTTAMRDPTEGGPAAGLHEMAAASGIRLRVDRDPGAVVATGDRSVPRGRRRREDHPAPSRTPRTPTPATARAPAPGWTTSPGWTSSPE